MSQITVKTKFISIAGAEGNPLTEGGSESPKPTVFKNTVERNLSGVFLYDMDYNGL